MLHVLPVRVEKLHHLTDLTLTGSAHGQRVTSIENTQGGKTTNSVVYKYKKSMFLLQTSCVHINIHVIRFTYMCNNNIIYAELEVC